MSYVSEIKDDIKDGFLRNHYGKNKSLAILVNSVGNNQAYFYACNKASDFMQDRGDIDIFFCSLADDRPIIWPQGSILPMYKLANYKGPVLATSLATLEVALNGNFSEKYFYCYNLLEMQGLNQEVVARINDEFTVFTRTDDYARILKETFGIRMRTDLVRVADFNMNNIAKIVGW